MSFSQYKDKQVMGLAGTQSGDLLDLMDTPPDAHYRGNGGGGAYREEIAPNYDIQQDRNAFGPSSPPPPSNYKSYSSLGPQESPIITCERARGTSEVTTVAEIDRIMKKHVDTLLDELEDVKTRFSLFENRTRNLENSVNDLKVSVKNCAGCTDGKLRQLENILREVQNDVQDLHDKQEIAEAQLQLSKLQAFKGDHQTSYTTSDSQQLSAPPEKPVQQPQPASVPPQQVTSSPLLAPLASNAPPPCPPQQSIQQSYLPITSQQATFPRHSMNPTPNAPPPPPSQQNPSLVQEFPPPGQSRLPTPHQSLAQPLPPPQQHYGSPPVPQQQHVASVPPPPQVQQNCPPGPPRPHQHPFPQHPEETPPYVSQHQTYPPNIRQTTPNQSHNGPTAPPPQFYGTNPNIYEFPVSRVGSGQLPYPAGFPESYSQEVSPRYGNSRPSQFSSGGSSNSRLPRAEILPHAESDSSDNRARVPVDNVVDQVAKMGFSREQVRTTVKKLTENGQSVDLNVVLDKLMNDNDVIQPQNIWRA